MGTCFSTCWPSKRVTLITLLPIFRFLNEQSRPRVPVRVLLLLRIYAWFSYNWLSWLLPFIFQSEYLNWSPRNPSLCSISSQLSRRPPLIRTPVETFYDDAVKKLNIQADPKKIEEIIKRRLQEELAKEKRGSSENIHIWKNLSVKEKSIGKVLEKA